MRAAPMQSNISRALSMYSAPPSRCQLSLFFLLGLSVSPMSGAENGGLYGLTIKQGTSYIAAVA